jgi:hypothetical protein
MQSKSDGSRGRRRVAHYMQRTVASSAPEYANHEQDVIRQSFSIGNHTWMKEALPVELVPDSVNRLRRQRMERSRLSEPLPQTWSKMTQLWGGGCYQEFEYMADEYSRKAELNKTNRLERVAMREKISNHEWRHTSQEKRMKHETLINDPRNKEPYPYLGGDKDLELNLSFTDGNYLRSGSLSGALPGGCHSVTLAHERAQGPPEGAFLAGKGGGLEEDSRGSRMTLPILVQRLQKRLDADWEGSTVVVTATDQDLVQIAFQLGTVDSERGVQAYMSVLSKDPELLGALGMRKVSQLWGMRRDFTAEAGESISNAGEPGGNTWIFYLLTPKWVRMRPTDAYYTTHPRSQGSAFRMSTAGSSVLLSLGSAMRDPSENARAKGGSATYRGVTPRSGMASAERNRSAPARGCQSARGDPHSHEAIERALQTLPALRQTQ